MAYEQDFMTDPLDFLRRTPLTPFSGAVWHSATLKSWAEDAVTEGGIRQIAIADTTYASHTYAKLKPDVLFPGALELRTDDAFASRPTPDPRNRLSIPIFWLPWDSGKIVRCKIPLAPPDLKPFEEHRYPRFFATAGISGCSVMFQGPEPSPMIYHAGVTGTLRVAAHDFWPQQMAKAAKEINQNVAFDTAVHSRDYTPEDRPLIQRFMEWKLSEDAGGFDVKITKPFGAIIGQRKGENWKFYLQENLMLEHVRFLKRSDINSHLEGAYKPVERFAAKDGHEGEIKPANSKVKEPRFKMGSHSFGSKTKVVKLYAQTSYNCQVVAVGEVYPVKKSKSNFSWGTAVGG